MGSPIKHNKQFFLHQLKTMTSQAHWLPENIGFGTLMKQSFPSNKWNQSGNIPTATF